MPPYKEWPVPLQWAQLELFLEELDRELARLGVRTDARLHAAVAAEELLAAAQSAGGEALACRLAPPGLLAFRFTRAGQSFVPELGGLRALLERPGFSELRFHAREGTCVLQLPADAAY